MIDLYFDPKYAKLYENIDGKSDTFYFSCEYGSVQNTYILREIKWKFENKTYYDIITPYGYGGPLITECSDLENLMNSYREAFSRHCLENNIVCEFIRFHLYDNVQVRENYYGEVVQVLDNVVVDTTKPYDEIWMKYEHKVRKNVKKAIGNELKILIENDLNHLGDFLDIYYKTMNRNNASKYYYFEKSYFEDIAKLLPEKYCFFYVLKDEKVIATELVLCSKQYAYSFLGGTNENFYAMRPNDFLKNEIIKWCNVTGRNKFILGGGYHKGDGIYCYKRSFTSDSDVPFYVGRYIFNSEAYDYFVSLRKKEEPALDDNSMFFPLYRA